MDWKVYAVERPEENKRLVVFRIKKNKYVVAKLHRDADFLSSESDEYSWVTEVKTCVEIDPDDRWIYLEPVIITKVYN